MIEFTPTKWATADDKAKFLKRLITFVKADFDKKKFTKAMYRQLSNMFGHIAHYDREGFYSAQFSTDRRRLAWMDYVAGIAVYGDPAWTWSDVEREFQSWLHSDYGEAVKQRISERLSVAIEYREHAEYERLKAKFGD